MTQFNELCYDGVVREIETLTRKQFKATVNQEIIEKTMALVVGGRYFLSDFGDRSGAWVTVDAKSTELNTGGFPSSVTVKVIQPIGFEGTTGMAKFQQKHYAAGTVHIVNATNLYTSREDAR